MIYAICVKCISQYAFIFEFIILTIAISFSVCSLIWKKLVCEMSGTSLVYFLCFCCFFLFCLFLSYRLHLTVGIHLSLSADINSASLLKRLFLNLCHPDFFVDRFFFYSDYLCQRTRKIQASLSLFLASSYLRRASS